MSVFFDINYSRSRKLNFQKVQRLEKMPQLGGITLSIKQFDKVTRETEFRPRSLVTFNGYITRKYGNEGINCHSNAGETICVPRRFFLLRGESEVAGRLAVVAEFRPHY
jgi:hypothetical protein